MLSSGQLLVALAVNIRLRSPEGRAMLASATAIFAGLMYAYLSGQYAHRLLGFVIACAVGLLLGIATWGRGSWSATSRSRLTRAEPAIVGGLALILAAIGGSLIVWLALVLFAWMVAMAIGSTGDFISGVDRAPEVITREDEAQS